MKKENKDIIMLATEVLGQLEGYGLTDSTIEVNRCCLQAICSYYAACGYDEYEPSVMQKYLEELQEQVRNGGISHGYANILKRAAMLLEDTANGKTTTWKHRSIGSRIALGQYYEGMLADFLQAQTLADSTLSGMRTMLRKYLSYLEKAGYENTDAIRAEDFAKYVVESGLSGSSLSYMKYCVKKLYSYLQETREVNLVWQKILNEPCVQEIRIRPYTIKSELDEILRQIDTATPKGKRDNTCILLAARTGLRACDIIDLKFGDIDWRRFEIRIIQKKTKTPLALPLLAEVGEAIKDYILNGRPKSGCEYLFLRTKAPYQKIAKGVTLIQMFAQYQSMAGIARIPYDGKSFHSLRRAFGRSMVIAGVPVTTISQVLGHTNLESSKPYLSLDTQNLKICALDLREIEEDGQ